MTSPLRESRPAVVAVVGPTAAGKTAVALALAAELNGEIVNADAMQLYAGMDIGTAKVTALQRESVPHHLLDIWPVTARASVVDYQRQAVTAVNGLLAQRKTPVVVGGSGLYVRALLDDLRIPPTDADVRGRLEAELHSSGPEALHRRLTDLDPTAAAAILPSNGRRIVRALEVVELAGSFSATLPDGSYRWEPTVQVGLDVEDLDDRIERRVHEMFANGLVAEVAALEPLGLRGSPTAAKALGYAQVLAAQNVVAADGEGLDRESVITATIVATKRFARRQRSWFRRDQRILWCSSPEEAIREARAAVRAVQ